MGSTRQDIPTIPSTSTQDRIGALTAFQPVFEAPGFEFGRWSGPSTSANGAITMPMCESSSEAARFVQAGHDFGWVLHQFDWANWPDADRLMNGPAAVATDADTVAKLLTAQLRADRFNEGHLASIFASGHLNAILLRLKAIAADQEVVT